MDDMINNGMDIPKWMTTGKTILFQKDLGKGNAVNNYWSISCLPFMWKLMTGIITNNIYEYLECLTCFFSNRKGAGETAEGQRINS